mgnify:CR=1 FL=1
MKKSRFQTFLIVGVVGAGVLLAALVGMWAYMMATPPLHPNAADVPTVARAGTPPAWNAAADRGRQIVLAALVDQSLPGVSVAVGTGGEIVWAEGFGYADFENRVPVTPQTRFRIGTASKALTSAGVGLLLERQRLALDEKIQAYVPQFPEKPWPVTLRRLMGHTAGLRNDGGDEGPYAEHCEQTIEGLDLFKDQDLLFEPGTSYRDSNYGWILVSAAVEAAAGEPFQRFMRREIFEPLGMTDTRPDSANEHVSNRATSYFPRFAAEPKYGYHLMRPIDLSCWAGAAVFLSTPSDLVRFMMAVNSGTLLKHSTIDLLRAPQRLASGEETAYGLGWTIETVALGGADTRGAGHEGMVLGGPTTALITFPGRDLSVAVTSNIPYTQAKALAAAVAQAFAAHGPPARAPR